MLLGSRHGVAHYAACFVDSGTIHVFAISGLHIVLVAAVLVLLPGRGAGRAAPLLGVSRGAAADIYTVTTGARRRGPRLPDSAHFLAPLAAQAERAGRAGRHRADRPRGAAVADLRHRVHVLSFVVMGGLVVFCGRFCEAGQRLCRIGRLGEQARLLDAAGGSAGAAGRLAENGGAGNRIPSYS